MFRSRLPKAQYGVWRRPSWNRYFFLNLLESLFKAGTDFVPYETIFNLVLIAVGPQASACVRNLVNIVICCVLILF